MEVGTSRAHRNGSRASQASRHSKLPLASILVALAALLTFGTGALAQQKPAQTEARMEREIKVKVALSYLVYLPHDYEKSESRWPLVLFLHGAGETGSDLNRVKAHGPPKLVEAGKQFPFILISPQAPALGWRPEALNALLDEVSEKYRVDPDRIYCTGLSMGGFGTWALAAAYPERLAAIAPICGGGDPRSASRIKHIPAWVFHGAKDNLVPLARSQEMVDALKAAGAEPKFTVYPEAGHDSWTEAYNTEDLYTWLLSQRRAKR